MSAALAAPQTPAAPQAEQPVTSAAAPAAPAPASAAVETTTPAADPKAEIAALASQFGFDPAQFDGFADVESAKNAVRLFATSAAQQGMNAIAGAQTPAAPAQTVAPQSAPAPAQPAAAVQPIDLKAIGLDDDDPAAKAIRALEQRFSAVDAAQQSARDLSARIEAMETAAREQTQQRLQAEAASVVDGFADPRYGVGGNRTPAQQWSVQRLYDLADAILVGAYQTGRPLPSLSARLAQARLIDAQQSAAPAPLAPPAAPSVLPSASAPAAPRATGMKITDRWSQNPEIRAKLGL